MNVPVLRKTIRLAYLAATPIPVRTVLAFDKRRVHLATAFRFLQSRPDLLVRSEDRPVIDFRHSTVLTRLVDRRIHQIIRCNTNRSTRTTRQTGRRRNVPLAERFQNHRRIRLPLVTRNQSRRLEIQASGGILHQCPRIVFRSFSINHFEDEFVLGIQGDMIPVVATTGVRRIIFVAIFLFLLNKVPLFVELDFLRLGGKARRVRHGGFRRVLRRALCNDLPYQDRLSISVRFSASRSPRRRVPEWIRRFPRAVARRTGPFPVVRRIFSCKPGNTAVVCCSVRIGHGRGCFRRPEHRVWDSFYSDNKSFSNRP